MSLFFFFFIPDDIGDQRRQQQPAGPVGVRENERPHGHRQVGNRASFPAAGGRSQHHGSQRTTGRPAAATAAATAVEAAPGARVRRTARVHSKSGRRHAQAAATATATRARSTDDSGRVRHRPPTGRDCPAADPSEAARPGSARAPERPAAATIRPVGAASSELPAATAANPTATADRPAAAVVPGLLSQRHAASGQQTLQREHTLFSEPRD